MTEKPVWQNEITENVRVYIRIRPNSNENPVSYKVVNNNLIYFSRTNNTHSRSYRFNKVFEENSTQNDIYSAIAAPIVNRTLQGFNGTIFAYGQSGTGKTYTMLGDTNNILSRGIVPNIFTHIFDEISTKSNDTFSYAITVTFLEIYNEEIRDLLNQDHTKKLVIRETPDLGVYVKYLSGYTVESMQNAIEVLQQGTRSRTVGATKLNDVSSRSHAIFSIMVEKRSKIDETTTIGKLNLVDLAGSERVVKTQATGQRLREAGKINLSLSVLGNVISALVDGKHSHIPYRNSKLTRLLEDSLGGNSLTSMIATISPLEADFEESVYTLMYAERVKNVKNCLRINTIENKNKSLLKTFEDKIASLQNELLKLELHEKAQKKERRNVQLNEGLQRINEEKCSLMKNIENIQKKILVGGENLIKKAQIQQDLIEDSVKKLEVLDSSHQLLQEILFYKNQEKDCVQNKYVSLQDEDKLLDEEIQRASLELKKSKKVLLQKECEYQSEISNLLHTNKLLAKDIGLVNFIVNRYVPKEYKEELESNVVWDEGLQDWKIKAVAYCGNNMRRRQHSDKNDNIVKKPNMYFKYSKNKSLK